MLKELLEALMENRKPENIVIKKRIDDGDVGIPVIPDGMEIKSLKNFVDEYKTKPADNCYSTARDFKIKEYLKLDNSNLNNLKSCLADGFAFIFGFTVFESFESDEVSKTGFVPMPAKHEKVLGGHAVMGIGYDDEKQVIICRNSWGKEWGDEGNFYLPYDYITNTDLASDFWTIRSL